MACEDDIGVTLESLFAYDGDFVATLGLFCGHYSHLKAALGTLWVTLGVTLGALAAYGGCFWGYFEISLGSVWVSVGDFGSLDGCFAMIVKSLWVYEGQFSKNTHFPNRF